MEIAQVVRNEPQMDRIDGKRKVALFDNSRGLNRNEKEQRPLKSNKHNQNKTSRDTVAEEHTQRNIPVEKEKEYKMGEKDKSNMSRGGSRVEFHKHTGCVVDFTKGLCRKMSTREVDALGIRGLIIVDPGNAL